ncbi:uncharacterized protein [Asterias amurensis]|uniref:uncharacterized protein n=1 Tax=Asterias amurensis TaxID=7602 RepID=UPI003AB7CBAF
MVDPGWKLVIPKKYLPYLGAGAAAVVTFAYILWGPDVNRGFNSRSGSKRKVAGLENLGNTCYLNTILQSLAACPGFVKWLSRALRRGFFKGKHNELAYKLSKTIEVVNDYSSSHSGAQVYSPHEVLHALYGCSWKSDRDQQDAHELFQFLLSVLGEDKEPVPSPLPLCDTSRFTGFDRSVFTQPDLHSNIEADLPKVSNKDGESPFKGLLANHLTCTVCGHKNPVTYSSFDCLTVPLPVSAFGTLSLESILAKFTQSELVHDVQCTECAKKLTGRTKQPPNRKPKSSAQKPQSRRDIKRRMRNSVTTPAVTLPITTTQTSEVVSATSETTPALSGINSMITPKMHSSIEATPTSTLAPMNCGIARPASDQGCGVVLPSGRSLSDKDLHARTPSSEKVSSDTSSTGYDTGSSGLEDRHGSINNGMNIQKPFQQVGVSELTSTSCCDNGGSVAEMEYLSEPPINGSAEEGAVSEHEKNSNLHSERSVEKGALQVLDKPQYLNGGQISIENPKSSLHNSCTNESMTQEVTKLSPECALANGVHEDVSDSIKNRNSSQALESKQEIRVSHQVPNTNRSLPTGKHVNGNHPTDRQRLNQDMENDFRSHNDADSIADRSSQQPADESEITPPKCHSTPKTCPPAFQSPSSSANQGIASEATPTTPSQSVFGKIPGTDGPPTLTPSDSVTNDITNEDLSPKCRRIFRKQLTLGKLPQCLCIHLQRVTWLSNGLPSRREEHIIFPEYLDMSLYKQTTAVNYTAQTTTAQSGVKLLRLLSEEEPMTSPQPPQRKASHGFIGSNFLAESGSKSPVGVSVPQLSPRISQQAPGFPVAEDGTTRLERMEGGVSGQSWRSDSIYRLASAVVHQGDAYSGHFLTFRRAPSTGTELLSDNWLCVSDESVYASTRKEVFSQKAYMLYYQRM